MWEQLQILQQSSTTSPRTVWVLGTPRVRTGQDDGINRPKVGLSERIGPGKPNLPLGGTRRVGGLLVVAGSPAEALALGHLPPSYPTVLGTEGPAFLLESLFKAWRAHAFLSSDH